MGFGQPSVQSPTLTPAQQGYQTAAANYLASQTGQPGQPYPGGLTAGLSPDQTASIGQLGAVGQGAGGPAAAQGLGTLAYTAGGGYLNDPHTANLIEQTRNQFYQNTVPQLTAPFTAAGQTGYSTPGQSAMAQAGATLETGLAGLQENAYQTERALQQQAAGQAVPFGLGAMSTGLSALTIPQQTQQTALTNAYNEWQRQQGVPFQAATGMPGLVGQGTQQIYGQSPFAEIASALFPAMMFHNLFPGFFGGGGGGGYPSYGT